MDFTMVEFWCAMSPVILFQYLIWHYIRNKVIKIAFIK